MAVITLDQAKAQLNIAATDTDHDDELQTYVAAAGDAVRGHTGHTVETATTTEYRTVRCADTLVLRTSPVASLTSVASVDGSVTWDVVADLELDSPAGIVTVLSGPLLSGRLKLVYEAGYATVPESYQLAALIIVQHLYETQRGTQGRRRGSVADEPYDPRYGYSIPRRALELLGAPMPKGG